MTAKQSGFEGGFNAEALLEQALAQRQWQLPDAWREGVLANLNRIHGMLGDLQALAPEQEPKP